jgi:hypothetical protein
MFCNIPSRDSNPGTPEYAAGMINNTPRRTVLSTVQTVESHTGVSGEHVACNEPCKKPAAKWFMLVSYLIYSSTLNMEEKCFSETSVNFQQATWYYSRQYVARK